MGKKFIFWGGNSKPDAAGLEREAAIAKASSKHAPSEVEKDAQSKLADVLKRSAREIRGE